MYKWGSQRASCLFAERGERGFGGERSFPPKKVNQGRAKLSPEKSKSEESNAFP